MLVFLPREAAVHPLLLDELVSARIDDLRRQAARERRALSLHRPSLAATVTRRSLRAFGFLLVRAGLRLAVAGDGGRPAARRGIA
jgi:hypothetical protein